MPPLFDKHSGGYGIGLIDVAEKPKVLNVFDNAGRVGVKYQIMLEILVLCFWV